MKMMIVFVVPHFKMKMILSRLRRIEYEDDNNLCCAALKMDNDRLRHAALKMMITCATLKMKMMIHEGDDRFYYAALKMKMMIVSTVLP